MVEKSIRSDGRTVTPSNIDKVLYPDDGITKGDVLDYYQDVSGVMLPHLRGRPLAHRAVRQGHRHPTGGSRPRPAHHRAAQLGCYHIGNIRQRLAHKSDPWADLDRHRRSARTARNRLDQRAAGN